MTIDPKISAMEKRVEELRKQLFGTSIHHLSIRIDGNIIINQPNSRSIGVSLWGKPIRIDFPAIVAYDQTTNLPLPLTMQALVVYHLVTADGFRLQNRWISFAELPGGLFYQQAFQGYTGNELVKIFGQNLDAFTQASLQAGGNVAKPAIGDAAFSYQVLPRVPLLLVYWLGDDEFPPSAKILFDASASHYLPTDVYAIAGSMLVGRIIKQYKSNH